MYARIANLATSTRNGTGIGGGRLVGYLPVVSSSFIHSARVSITQRDPQQIEDDELHKTKTPYVDFKKVVWHKCFSKILETLQEPSKSGRNVVCGDGETRNLFPLVSILSADYEEQCVSRFCSHIPLLNGSSRVVMATIIGRPNDFPCTVCLIHKDDILDYSNDDNLERRSGEESVKLVAKAKAQATQNAVKKNLKGTSTGLRPVEVRLFSALHAPATDRLALSSECFYVDCKLRSV